MALTLMRVHVQMETPPESPQKPSDPPFSRCTCNATTHISVVPPDPPTSLNRPQKHRTRCFVYRHECVKPAYCLSNLSLIELLFHPLYHPATQSNEPSNEPLEHNRYQRQQRKEGLLPNADNLTFSPSRIKCHHPKCPKYSNRKPSSIQDQMITVMVPLNSASNNINNNNNNNSNSSNHNGSGNHTAAGGGNNNNNNNNNNAASCTTVALVNGINGSAASVTMSSAHHQQHQLLQHQQQQHQNQQQQQQQQHSSSDNTEQSLAPDGLPRSSSLKKSTAHHQLKPEGSAAEQKTILLKFPQQMIDSEQLIVSMVNYAAFSSIHKYRTPKIDSIRKQ